MPSFPFYKQLDAMDCGPTCLRMVARHYGKHFTLHEVHLEIVLCDYLAQVKVQINLLVLILSCRLRVLILLLCR